VKGKPRVKEYMASHRASVTAAIVLHESAALAEYDIGREQIMAQYWDLEPSETRTRADESEHHRPGSGPRLLTRDVGPRGAPARREAGGRRRG
jgi:hypothetical protein